MRASDKQPNQGVYMRNDRTLRGKVAIVGIGETQYYRHGKSPDSEFKMALKAILAACSDAHLDPTEIEGICSFSNDRCDPSRLAAALGMKTLRSTVMQWGGGGGGCAAAVANGAAAIHAGLADCVVIYRSLAQGEQGRFGQSTQAATISGDMAYQTPYGMMAPPQKFAMKAQRFIHEHSVDTQVFRAIARAANYHAQLNPRAVMYGKPLTDSLYDQSRWIVEPFRLFDCCMENDGAAAAILVSADRAKDFPHAPVYILGAASGSDWRAGAGAHNAPHYASAGFTSVAKHAFRMANVTPQDVGAVQSYENFTPGVAMALMEHGFFQPEEINRFLTFENLTAPAGKLPLNTSGGNLGECYVHGFELVVEAVRQVRGDSTSQASRSDVGLVIGGPMVSPTSSLIVGSGATL
jgi:acetyl-CoA acetyltransferase